MRSPRGLTATSDNKAKRGLRKSPGRDGDRGAETSRDDGEIASIDLSRKERTTARIMDAALSLISQHGASSISMQAIGKAARVSRANLYRHFPSKQDLLDSISERLREEFANQLQKTMPTSASPAQVAERLIVFLENYYVHRDPGRFLEHEPQFTIESFRRDFGYYLTYLTAASGPLGVGAERGRTPPAPILAELLIRLMISDVFVPSSPRPLFITRFRPHLEALMEAAAGQSDNAPEKDLASQRETGRGRNQPAFRTEASGARAPRRKQP